MPVRVSANIAIAVMRRAGLEPLDDYVNSKAKWRCRCVVCSAIVFPCYNQIQQGWGGCSRCREARRSTPRTPTEVARWEFASAGAILIGEFPGVMEPSPCRCTRCRMQIYPTLHNVRSGQGACVYCAGNRIPRATARAIMATQAEPKTPYTRADEPWSCTCLRCGRDITPTLDSVRQGQSACKYCGGNAVDEAEAIEVMVAAGLRPLMPYPGSDQPWPCECQRCHREVSPRYHHVRRGRSTCRYCAGITIDPADAAARLRAANLEPHGRYPGATIGWPATCTQCGSQAKPRYSALVAIGLRSCPGCQTSGFRRDEPAVVYLVSSPEWNALKIGIANNARLRLDDHHRHRWSPCTWDGQLCIWPVATGAHAENIEADILRWWRNELGAPQAVDHADMPQRGASETVSLTAVSLDTTVQRIVALLQHDGQPAEITAERSFPAS